MNAKREWPPQASRRDLELDMISDDTDDARVRKTSLHDVVRRVTAEQPRAHPASFTELVDSLEPGTFHVIAGPTDIGQRKVAWSVAEEFARTRAPVLYVSMQLRADELIRRVLDAKRNARPAASSSGREDGETFAAAVEALASLPIAIDDRPALTLIDIGEHIGASRSVALPARCGAVIIDPVEHLVSPRRGNNDEERLWALAMELGDLARRCGVVVIATCATHPAYDDGWRPPKYMKATDVPWQFRHEADVLWLHHRENYFWKDGDALLRVSIRPRTGHPSTLAADMASGWPRWEPGDP